MPAKTFCNRQVREISEQLNCGFRAFYHKKTGELIFVPDTDKHYDMDTNAWQEEPDILEKNFTDYQEIYAMEASDSFKIWPTLQNNLQTKNFKKN